MPKRIIVCCDGTANDLRSDGTMWSNVGRIAECISEGKRVKQIVGYMSGIGTEGGRFRKMKDQATGYGLDQKILAAYGFICRHYEEGDSIVLIGFSRGAFIARCIVAFIGDVGVLLQPPLREKTVEGIYTEWTELMTSSFENTKRREILFVRYNSASEAKRVADGLALWDTVSSLHQSPPETYLDLVKTTPPWNVNYAFHALALEERRGLFKPDIWQGNYPTTVKSLKQCWFRGMHSHVGGSNEQWSNNLTNVSLSWIVSQLKENGLVSFEKDQLKRVFASDGTAKTKFQSRQDVGMKDSDNWLWRSLATFTGEKSGVRLPDKGTNEFLHWSIVSQPSQLLQPVPPMKLEIPLASWLPTEEATESEREAVRWPELYFYYTENRNMTPEEANGRLKVLQREIFGIERPDENNGGYLPLIRGERYCNAMSPSWLQTSSGETEGRFQVLDEVESQPQTLEQRPITTDAAYAGAPSASGSEPPQSVAYSSYTASNSSYATANNDNGSPDGSYATSTASVPYNPASSSRMPTERDGYQESQHYENGYQKGYEEGYRHGYQKGITASKGSTAYDITYNRDYIRSSDKSQNYESANVEFQDYPIRGPGYASTSGTRGKCYFRDSRTGAIDNAVDAEAKPANGKDDETFRREYSLEKHQRSRDKSLKHRPRQ
ncbi:hypothetical protein ACHAQD_002670 [Fusarium lateritium]